MDELIKLLRVCGDSNNSCGDCPIRENDGSCPHGEWEFAAEKYMLQAAEAIEELQGWNNILSDSVAMLTKQIVELSKPRWIPVTERLPEGNIQVIVSSGIFVPFMEMAFYDGLWYSAWDGETEIEAVTHWMPLPQPPKEET